MPAFIDLTGRSFGRWTVLKRAHDYRRGHPQWLCRCECGNEGVVRGQTLARGESRSCGCYNADVHRAQCIERNRTHGLAKTKAHRTWVNMVQRCINPRCTGFKKYGARGITVCDRWRTFEHFLADMGECPSEAHTIDRIDNTKGYEPGNCRWATMKAQQNNRTNNRLITHAGETLTLMQWAERAGLDSHTIAHRLGRLGWPIEQALTLPASPRPRRSRQVLAPIRG